MNRIAIAPLRPRNTIGEWMVRHLYRFLDEVETVRGEIARRGDRWAACEIVMLRRRLAKKDVASCTGSNV